ncbi:enoyl-CoA hydratase/isomerase family protein [Pseudonocardia benzenivorans]|uniref:Enoyl-CoA hydratase/isomerase n=2 Tax=Pseudonocardia TaxID=1847 RepID=F4CTU6_PSEUX|nr:enoyl-CoA hydratase/isomerase family protein [Pseudonocardia dioxanivorans]AEA22905.1 Enoyl-CoA hydratase/isomerase [Pseudonocardia dioxanivorans CB1190]GJF05007.1 enoyl-CoA hydratase [Pseudonocardia sp. D17]
MIERVDDDGVAVLTMAHGPVNAMDIELCRAVAETFRGLASDPARAVVLTAGGGSFSAGVDLKRFLDGGAPYAEEFLPALADSFRAVFDLTKPVVAAVNGHAIAGGCVLAACADVVLMADGKGRIGVPELKVGVPFPRIALEAMRFAVGETTARRMITGAGTYTAADAHGLGLVDEIVDPGELRDRAVAAARAMADDVPADTFAVTKAALRREASERADRYADDDEAVLRLWSTRATDGWVAEYLARVTRR